jgi:4-hydroxymandelate oxidase
MELVNVFDYERLAAAKMEPSAWAYYQSGADDEVTLRANRAAFERIWLRPRFLRDVAEVAMATTALGTPVSMPILVAPTGLHGPAHPDGECATALAVGEMGTLMIASDSASRSMEDIAASATGPLWYQLYTSDRETTAERVRRATVAGYRAIVLTVDAPRWGRKERALRSDFDVPPHVMTYGNYTSLEVKRAIMPLTWEVFDWLRSLTPLPFLIKGILTAEDAELAVAHGAAGVIVSNHGGRQLDGAIPSIAALPEIAEAVGDRCEVYMDGGIRRGTDVLKALALGARAVLVGRPILWGLAAEGPAGVRGVLAMLRAEFEQAMALAGCASLADITPDLLRLGF